METIISTISKSAREEIRISLTEYKGHDLLDVRVFAEPYEDKGQDSVATRKGISCKISLLPQLIAALQDAECQAREVGLLPEDRAEDPKSAVQEEQTVLAAG
jgi:hypothetical protein